MTRRGIFFRATVGVNAGSPLRGNRKGSRVSAEENFLECGQDIFTSPDPTEEFLLWREWRARPKISTVPQVAGPAETRRSGLPGLGRLIYTHSLPVGH